MTRKTSASLEFLNARLDEIRMSDYERLRAKASLAQAEAITDAIALVANRVARWLKSWVLCPIRRLASSLG